uniref:Cation_ATPase_N domain-containing protein n=1 Tax=Caenorhabditis japonica TaxID=281687 RepID=A0A8R1ESE2_CAEJA
MLGCCNKKTNKSLDELKKDIVIDDHEISLEALLKRYSTSGTAGISEGEAASRLRSDGPNALTPPKQTSKWVKLAGSVFGGFNFCSGVLRSRRV